jgi:mTERF
LQARRLSVENDIKPVVAFFERMGLSNAEIVDIISVHPPVLSYDPASRLQALVDYLSSIGITDTKQVILRRPSLLGLSVSDNLRRIVEYLLENDYTMEQVEEFLQTTI